MSMQVSKASKDSPATIVYKDDLDTE